MKTALYALLLAALLCGAYWLGLKSKPPADALNSSPNDDVLYWVAPMDSSFRRDQPGKSPMGMDLVPVYADPSTSDPATVTVPSTTLQSLGLRTGKVQLGVWTNPIITTGIATWDEQSMTNLYSRSEGWLERLSIQSEGEQIKAGDTLFEIYSPSLVTAQKEYVNALKSGSARLIDASKQRLVSLGVDADQIEEITKKKRVLKHLPFVAANNAIVASLHVRKGSYVKPDTLIGTLVSEDRFWLDVSVLESDSGLIRLGDEARVQFIALPGRQWKGRVDYIYPNLESTTRTVRLRVVLDNPSSLIKKGMFAKVSIDTKSYQTLQVAKQAVIHAGAGSRVVIRNGDGSFTVRPVYLGRSNQNYSEVISGLFEGEEVVTSAQFLIDSEANGAQALSRLDSLGNASGSATILGFPRRGKIRLRYQLYGTERYSENAVISVAPSVDLMPYNKQDKITASFMVNDGELTLIDLRPSSSDSDMRQGMEMTHD